MLELAYLLNQRRVKMEQKTLSRREFLRMATVAAAGTVGAALAGCAQPAPGVVEKVVKETVVVEVEGTPEVVEVTKIVEVAPPLETVEIVYLGADESGAGAVAFDVYTDQVIPPFIEENPHIKVTFEPAVGDWDDMIIADAAAGTAPDIFPHWAEFGRRLMEEGQMLALQDYIPQEDLDDFLEQQLIACRVGPSLFALPRYISTVALTYNKDYLDEAGIEYPDETWDWTDLENALQQLGEMGTSERGTLFPYYVNPWYQPVFVWANGGEWMNKEYMGTKMLIDQPEAMEALRWQYDMIYRHGYAPTGEEVEGLGWWEAWQSGRFAFYEGHSWQVSEFVSVCDWEWDYAPLPKNPNTGERGGIVFNDSQSVYAGTKHPVEAVEFLRYVSSPEVEKIMMTSVHGWQPCRRSLDEEWITESAGAKAGKNVKAFIDILPTVRQDPYFMNDAQVKEIYEPIWDQIWVTGDIGLDEGVQRIVTSVNEYLDSVA